MSPVPDPFGTADLRRVVLDAWAASPARFREDANAEDLLAAGGYAGRALIELAANGVDAALAAGVPARLRLRLHDGELRVANVGAPLTAAGVAALASLRASAKRDVTDSVGFFGVGFTAVLTWTDAPAVVSTTGGVRFGADDTRAAVRALDRKALDDELRRRGGHVPVLRLPWPVDGTPQPPPGYATEVRLPLAEAVRDEVRVLLADRDTAEDLLWALPDLVEIDLPDGVLRRHRDADGTVTVDDGHRRHTYRTATRTGAVPAERQTGRPVEQQGRTGWRISWVLPLDPAPDDRQHTVGAPIPTDEPLTLPARLIGTFPVDDTRRRLASGPLGDYLLDRAADAYLDLVMGAAADRRWTLLPVGGFPAGPVDGTLREAILSRAGRVPMFASATGDWVTAADACVLPGLDADGAAAIGQAVPGLLAPLPAAAAPVLRGLGTRTIGWSQASAALAGIDRPPSFWRGVYRAAAQAQPPPRADDLADVPVPLVGGRRAVGARGCLLPAAGPAGSAGVDAHLAGRVGEVVPGLRIVHPDAAHPLLERLGARPAEPAAVLADPALADRVGRLRRELEETDLDADEVVPVAEVVLDLLSGADTIAGASGADGAAVRRLLGDLLLTDDDGNPWPASELMLPDAPLGQVLAPDVDRIPVGSRWWRDYGAPVLVRAGVRAGFPVVTVDDIDADHERLPDLDEWADLGDRGPVADHAEPFRALADLDLVDESRWAAALALIAADRDARDCLAPIGNRPSYSAWWIARHALLAGRPPGAWRLPSAGDLDGLYDPLPVDLDDTVARWIGVRADLDAAAADDPADLLDRLADPARTIPAARVPVLTQALVAALDRADGPDPDLPSGVRTLTGEVVDAGDAFVLDEPWWVQVVRPSRLVPGGADPAAVSRVLDLPTVSGAMVDATVRIVGAADPSAAARWSLAAAATGTDPASVPVTIAGTVQVAVDGEPGQAVAWWWADGRYYSDGSPGSLGRIAAWAAGAWSRRHLAAAAAGLDAAELAEAGVVRG